MCYAKELSIILAARKRSSSASALCSFLIGAIMIGAFLAVSGLIDAEGFAYAAVVVALIAVFSPKLRSGATPEDLLDSRENQLEQ